MLFSCRQQGPALKESAAPLSLTFPSHLHFKFGDC